MEVSATYKHAKISAQKVRLVINQIRGLSAEEALNCLNFSPKKAAKIIIKVLNSAISNAEHNHSANIDDLFVSTAYVDEAPTAKRFRCRAKGRGDRVLKRASHVTVKVQAPSEI